MTALPPVSCAAARPAINKNPRALVNETIVVVYLAYVIFPLNKETHPFIKDQRCHIVCLKVLY